MDFHAFLDELAATARADDRIIGLVLLGSTAEPERVDQWSDHDFFLVTHDGRQEELRQEISWLPRHHELAFTVRETAHGLKAVYRDGHVLEYAVFDLAELAGCAVNHWQVVYGDDAVRGATLAAVKTAGPIDPSREWSLFLALILIAVGRARRGELLAAGQGIRSYAVSHLLRMMSADVDDARLDFFDPTRRAEQVHGQWGEDIAAAVAQEPEQAAQRLLGIAMRFITESQSAVNSSLALPVISRLQWDATAFGIPSAD